MSDHISRRAFLRLGIRSAIGLAAFGGACLGYAGEIEPRWIDIHPVTVRLPRLAPEFDGYRLVQISDIHMGGGLPPDFLLKIVTLINEQEPDLVAITGDFILEHTEQFTDDMVAVLSRLTPHDGTVAIVGNRDYCPEADGVKARIRKCGMIDLCNQVLTLPCGQARLHVAGIDDVLEQRDRLKVVHSMLTEPGAAILLVHEPDYADVTSASGRFDLQLSGHSHGGQVNIPLVGPLVLPELARKYPEGRYRVGSMILYTNRGIGMIEPYIRFNCRPEITVFTLEADAA